MNRLLIPALWVFSASWGVSSTLEVGLVAHYQLNGNLSDRKGNLNPAVNYGSTFTEDRFGNSNNAISFDGSQYAIINNLSTVLTNASSGITVSAWYKSSKEFFSGFIQNDFNNPMPSPALRIGVYGGNKLYGNLGAWGEYPGGPYLSAITEETFTYNQWHQIVGVIEFGQIPRFYLDGQLCSLITTPPVITSPFTFDSKFAVGTSWEGGRLMTEQNYVQDGG